MISLIVPCFNGEEYINRCIDSILSQTYNDIELILINDGSTDNTDSLIKNRISEIKKTISRFIYLEQKNQGVGAACNNAFKYITGKYLILLDVDDILMPDSIKLQKEWLDNHDDYGLVRTNGYYVQEDNLSIDCNLFEVNEYMKIKENIFEDIFFSNTYLWPGSYMMRVDLLEKIYPNRDIYPSRNGQNMQFVMMMSYFYKAGFIDRPLMKYTIRKESLSHFTTGLVKEKEISAFKGYKDIRENLIKTLMCENEQNYWLNQNEILYAKIFMNLAIKYKDKRLMKQNYNILKKLTNGKIALNDMIVYYKLNGIFIYYILKVFRKIKYICIDRGN